MRRYAARRDANEPEVLANVERLGGLWIPGPPLDGWLWDRRAWQLCEVKEPRKEGHMDEFTPAQLRLIAKLEARVIPYQVLRVEDDVLRLLGAR